FFYVYYFFNFYKLLYILPYQFFKNANKNDGLKKIVFLFLKLFGTAWLTLPPLRSRYWFS
ncbi:hypothetical protein, partial [Enterobacter cloacae complex sp. 2DZ2F20B]|uniref:hypothetical protein n=1 Tax=Enterobacter cloacae complex sp. 2DZ2F20B TaxID=2511993 RepID=UPI0010272629